ncbi:MAG: tetratricopeptide repeat protein [Planctomycetes bacterium]|nr:tetratricopeptide repeat protein [Planctomycetota bacterium]
MRTSPFLLAAWAGAVLGALILPAPARGQDGAGILEDAQQKLLKGLYGGALRRFEKARTTLEAELGENPANAETLRKALAEARWGEIRALEATGKYADAEKRAAEALAAAAGPEASRLQVFLADLMARTGRLPQALEAYRKVVAAEPENLRARLGEGLALIALGKKAEGTKALDWFVGHWAARKGQPDAEVLECVAGACIGLGPVEQDLYLDAQKLLEQCEKQFPERQDARVALARLYMDRYVHAYARPVLAELFKINPNHPGGRAAMALFHIASWRNREAAEEADRALAVNPNLAEALKAKAMVQIADQVYREAEAPLRKAVEVDPADVEAWSLLAGCRFLAGDREGFEEIEKKVAALRPGYGGFYETVGGMIEQHRRLDEAVAMHRRAVETDPGLWTGWFSLGTTLSRQGEYAKAKEALEKGFTGDSYNRMARNLLTLFDDYVHFTPHKTEHFEMLFHKKEEAVMSRYCGRLLEESWKVLTAKYGFEPAVPVRVEMFTQADDFAVRTLGFPGLGALGACFGPLITLDSPQALRMGQFNWASTVWHEYAHVVTVQLSSGRVPRWFTEGLSVYEERCGRAYWFRPAHRTLLGRLRAGGLTPLPELNAQFTRGDVLLAYFHASYVVEFLVETRGFDAIVAMLRAYGRDLNDEGVFREVLKETPLTLDAKFKEWLAAKYASRKVSPLFSEEERAKLKLATEKTPGDAALLARLARACLQNGKAADAEIAAGRAREADPKNGEAANVLGEILFLKQRFEAAEKFFREAVEAKADDYNTWIRLATLAEQKENDDEALRCWEAARDAFPEFVGGPDTPVLRLRVHYEKRKRDAEALKAMETAASMLETDIPLRLELAGIYRKTGESDKLERTLREIHEIWPFTLPPEREGAPPPDTHMELGRLLAAKGKWDEAIVEGEVALWCAQMAKEKPPKEREVEIRLLIAEGLGKLGRSDDALDHLEQILEVLDPGNKKAAELMKALEGKGK